MKERDGCQFRPVDYGADPMVVNIDRYAKSNPYFRRTLWTGSYLQMTLMSIPVCGEIGLEMHQDFDQFIRIESGNALVKMGSGASCLPYQKRIDQDYAIVIPAGTWHNVINIGKTPLKLYSIYAPPHHPYGTVHPTKKAADAAEHS